MADGSRFRDISQPFLKEEEMVVNMGDPLSSATWVYISTQTSVTPAASEFPNQNNCFAIFKVDGTSLGTGPDFFTSRIRQSKLYLGNPCRIQEPYPGLVHVQRLDFSLLNRQIKVMLKGSVSSQMQTLKGCEISTYVWEERSHHLNSPLNLL